MWGGVQDVLNMTLDMWAWTGFVFLMGILFGGLIWIPMTIKRQQEEFAQRMELARKAQKLASDGR